MANTIANVLVGVAALSVKQTTDPVAEWSDEQHQAGSYSAKLIKTGTGTDGSTHVQFNPTIATVTLTEFDTAVTAGTGFSFYHREGSTINSNWAQIEFHFDDPLSDGWFEITCVPLQGIAGVMAWQQYTIVVGTPSGYGGNTPDGSSVFDWSMANDLTNIDSDMAALFEAAQLGSGTQTINYVLTRVRVELWEDGTARSSYIDTVEIDSTAYPIEPESATPGLVMGSTFTQVGYTEDGVTVEYTADETDIEVEEETFPIDRVITKETAAVTCNMAESSLVNISSAMAGSLLSGNAVILGGGANKRLNIRIEGLDPDGLKAVVCLPIATATGAVGMSYKKGEKTVVPVTFQALKGIGPAVTIVYDAAP